MVSFSLSPFTLCHRCIGRSRIDPEKSRVSDFTGILRKQKERENRGGGGGAGGGHSIPKACVRARALAIHATFVGALPYPILFLDLIQNKMSDYEKNSYSDSEA